MPGGITPEIRSEPRGPHWIAWIADEHGKPVNAVVVVGETRTAAETGARELAGQIASR
jgi:hypothetical protein